MSEPNQHRCLVLLPPDPHFTRLFEELLAPTLSEIGFSADLVQPQAPLARQASLLQQIERADVLLADLSTAHPGVWYAVGYATALEKPLCLLSSHSMPHEDELSSIVHYPAVALPGDYLGLQQNITRHLARFKPQREMSVKESSQSSPTPSETSDDSFTGRPSPAEDLVSYEILALTILDAKSTNSGLTPRDLSIEMRDKDSAHLTSHAMNALKRRGFIERRPVYLQDGEETLPSDSLFLTPLGRQWLLRYRKQATSTRNARPLFQAS
jgi:hypothetical protein